jgi:hypothetical protein
MHAELRSAHRAVAHPSRAVAVRAGRYGRAQTSAKVRRCSLGAVVLTLLVGCASSSSSTASGDVTSPRTTAPAASASTPDEAPATNTGVVGTVVRFSSGGTQVDVTIDQDTRAVRDFLSMLPQTLALEDLSGREKIAYLPRELDYGDTTGSDPEDGDLIYFTPWGNLGFYYDATGVGYSDQTLHLGTYTASREQLDALEGPEVTVDRLR